MVLSAPAVNFFCLSISARTAADRDPSAFAAPDFAVSAPPADFVAALFAAAAARLADAATTAADPAATILRNSRRDFVRMLPP
jgi:hypothetical protein